MIGWLTATVELTALALATGFFIETARAVTVRRRHLAVLVVFEVLLVAQLVVSIAKLASVDDGGQQMAVFIGYLAALVLVVPAAALWGMADTSRWGMGVVAAGCLTVAPLMLRLDQIWEYSLA